MITGGERVGCLVILCIRKSVNILLKAINSMLAVL